MIYSQDRRINSPTNNFREYIDPTNNIVHISVDFWLYRDIRDISDRDWILYHNGIKNLFRTNLIAVDNRYDTTQNPNSLRGALWVRMSAILVNDLSKTFIANIKSEDERRAREIREDIARAAQLEHENRIRFYHETQENVLAAAQARNDEVLENINRANVVVETATEPIDVKEVSPKRDFSNLILDE